MQIDLLYFENCPSWQGALENLMAAIEAELVDAEIYMVKVETGQEAARLMFLGSPSFQVNGLDWWPEQRERYNLSCHIYPTPQGMLGTPTIEMLREKLRAQ
jgi:hypothetical protein